VNKPIIDSARFSGDDLRIDVQTDTGTALFAIASKHLSVRENAQSTARDNESRICELLAIYGDLHEGGVVNRLN